MLMALCALCLPVALVGQTDSLPYPLEDRDGDFVTDEPSNPFWLEDPSAIEQTIEYDPETDEYIITETVDGRPIRPPMYLTYEEYLEHTMSREVDDYWRQRSETKQLLEGSDGLIPPINVDKKFFNKLFGGTTIDIQPQGNVELTLGGNVQKYDNPNLPQRARTQGGFDFDMNLNFAVTGRIGDKMQMTLRYNNQTGFNFDNEVKLQYTGEEDDIIQLIEAGNVSLPLNTQLITGAQSLFGIKTQLRFGRLTMTSILSQQRSEKQSIVVENGAQTQQFAIKADQYEADKHFFLGQFFRDNYEQALSNLPNQLSQVRIEEIEVWVTNRTAQTRDVRDVVGFMDLGEPDPHSPLVNSTGSTGNQTDNDANDLYRRLTADPSGRLVSNVVSTVEGPEFNLEPIQDYEKTYAKKLSPSEYTLNPELGYISLNTNLQPNQVLAVAYQYTFNGQVYQVGELSRNVPPDSSSAPKVLYLKMLKSTAIRVDLPIWDLMMKNIYSLGAYQIGQQDFRLDIFYIDPGGGRKRFLPSGNLSDEMLIRVLNLDRLNNQGDPQPDGVFDFLPGFTINPQNGRLIFPVVEPFGDYLRQELEDAGSGDLADQYVFDALYDSTLFIAQQFPELNRYEIKGQYSGEAGNVIRLPAFQLPEGSVIVSLGGARLVEGQDYTVDYNLGTVTIINDALLTSGGQIKIDFENNALFGFQQQNLMGTRLDYQVSEKLNLGGTVMRMTERPFSQKVNIGDDPIANTIMGLDVNYNTEAPGLTRVLDKLPFYSTNEMSTVSVNAEVAHLRPDHNKFVELDGDPVVYVDDFEGSSSGTDLKFPAVQWRLASTPRGATGKDGRELFPEASLSNDLDYGKNRAKLSWYQVDPSFFQQRFSPDVVYDDLEARTNHFVRPIFQSELFPNRDLDLNLEVITLNLNYYPSKRGPYNFDVNPTPYSKGVNPDGSLVDPESRWGGIMRGLENINFENSNIEYIEFWMLDPFVYDDTRSGGELHINLGSVSEDILKDSRMQFEQGLFNDPNLTDSTAWGRVPRGQPIANAFDNNENLRDVQDVGFDGLDDELEGVRYGQYLSELQAAGVPPEILARAQEDPAADNFIHYLADEYDDVSDIIQRYKDWNGPHGNSPVLSGDGNVSNSNTPDQEDLNRDNALNESEAFYQYIVELYPDMDVDNHPYIISKRDNPELVVEGQAVQPEYTWYQFRIPIRDFDGRIGNIQDFRSIQFFRMFLTNWEDSVNVRFGTLDLIRNQWRTYQYDLSTPTDNVPIDDPATFFNVAQVNFEEHNSKAPVNYILPPNIQRERGLGQNTNQLLQQNEQAMSLEVCGLEDGDARAVFKNVSLDFRNYERIQTDVHANRYAGERLPRDGEVTAFMRLGVDFVENYYEVEVPLQFTPDGTTYDNESETDRDIVWPDTNRIDVRVQDLIEAKKQRNAADVPLNVPYVYFTEDGTKITIRGLPDLGTIETVMLGVRNPSRNDPNRPLQDDPGTSVCAELWFNEFRLSGFDEEAGSAALGAVNIKLADLGTINFSTYMHGIGYGQVDMQVDERYQDRTFQYDFNTNLELGKFLPAKANVRIPFFANVSQTFVTPEFDPYQLDITSNDQVKFIEDEFGADSSRTYRRSIQTITTRRGFNFTNVRKLPGEDQGPLRFYNIENLAFTYSFNTIERSDPFIAGDVQKNYMGQINYTHSPETKYWYPFRKMIKAKTRWLDIIKEFNFNLFPSTLAFNSQWDRRFGTLDLRPLSEDGFQLPTTFDKFFTWNRTYSFRYNPFKSLSIDYQATNNARIDEPDGFIDTDEKKEFIWDNVLQGGRTTNFNQTLNINYDLPIDKLPLFEFLSARVGYSSTFNWIAAPRFRDAAGDFVANPLGNTMTNTQNLTLNGDVNFEKIYNRVPFLKKFNSGGTETAEARERKRENALKARERITKDIEQLKDQKAKEKEELAELKTALSMDTTMTRREKKQARKAQKKEIKDLRKQIRQRRRDRRKKQTPARIFENLVFQPLTSVKRISVNYSENRSTTVPGYVNETSFFGHDRIQNSPGYDFTFGGQPGFDLLNGYDPARRDAWLRDAADQGWISTDSLQNQKFTQSYTQNLDARATIEPFRDLQVDLTMTQQQTINHSQFFKYTTIDGVTDFFSLNPIDMGSYTVSTITWKTMFDDFVDTTWVNNTFEEFMANRSVISQRLQEENPASAGIYFNPSDTAFNDNFAEGYGPVSQDVLIPAFLAAYKGRDAERVRLNPLQTIPLPNWRITYNGLAKFPWARKVFSNLSITHGYQSTMTVNSFQTNLDYEGPDAYTEPQAIDSLNGNFYSQFTIPDLVINEQLSPLIGVDATFRNGLTLRFDYRKSRTMALNFSDFQMIETRSTQITAGLGYRVKGLKLPFKVKGKKVILHNDLNMRFDFSLRDNVTVNHLLDQGISRPTNGSKVISVTPSIDYVINDQLNLRIFLDRNRTIPATSRSFPTTSTRAGVTLRFNLANF